MPKPLARSCGRLEDRPLREVPPVSGCDCLGPREARLRVAQRSAADEVGPGVGALAHQGECRRIEGVQSLVIPRLERVPQVAEALDGEVAATPCALGARGEVVGGGERRRPRVGLAVADDAGREGHDGVARLGQSRIAHEHDGFQAPAVDRAVDRPRREPHDRSFAERRLAESAPVDRLQCPHARL